MKKVVIATATLGGGGAERAFINIANKLSEMGVEVKIMASGSRSVEPYRINSCIKVDRIVSLKSNKILKIIDKLNKFRKYFKQHKDYTFISFFPDVSAYCILASWGLRVRNIVSERNDPNTIPRKRYMKLIRNLAFRYASYCVFQTEDAKNYFGSSVRGKSIIISNPINTAILPIPNSIEKRKDIIIAVGRVVPQKNFGLLIRSWAMIADEFPSWQVHIYGDTTYRNGIFTKELSEEIRKLNVEGRIIFMGFSNEIYSKMNEASIYVSTSDFEGMSNTMLEAMSIGTPTIATDCPIGGARTIIEDGKNGILIRVGDEVGLVLSLRELILDADKRRRLSNEGVKLRDSLDIATVCKYWIEII